MMFPLLNAKTGISLPWEQMRASPAWGGGQRHSQGKPQSTAGSAWGRTINVTEESQGLLQNPGHQTPEPRGTLHSLRPGCAECHRQESPPAGLSTEPLQLLEGTSLKGDSGGKDQPSDTQWLPPWAETQRKKKEVQEEA